jgi:hypothetical protein
LTSPSSLSYTEVKEPETPSDEELEGFDFVTDKDLADPDAPESPIQAPSLSEKDYLRAVNATETPEPQEIKFREILIGLLTPLQKKLDACDKAISDYQREYEKIKYTEFGRHAKSTHDRLIEERAVLARQIAAAPFEAAAILNNKQAEYKDIQPALKDAISSIEAHEKEIQVINIMFQIVVALAAIENYASQINVANAEFKEATNNLSEGSAELKKATNEKNNIILLMTQQQTAAEKAIQKMLIACGKSLEEVKAKFNITAAFSEKDLIAAEKIKDDAIVASSTNKNLILEEMIQLAKRLNPSILMTRNSSAASFSANYGSIIIEEDKKQEEEKHDFLEDGVLLFSPKEETLAEEYNFIKPKSELPSYIIGAITSIPTAIFSISFVTGKQPKDLIKSLGSLSSFEIVQCIFYAINSQFVNTLVTAGFTTRAQKGLEALYKACASARQEPGQCALNIGQFVFAGLASVAQFELGVKSLAWVKDAAEGHVASPEKLAEVLGNLSGTINFFCTFVSRYVGLIKFAQRVSDWRNPTKRLQKDILKKLCKLKLEHADEVNRQINDIFKDQPFNDETVELVLAKIDGLQSDLEEKKDSVFEKDSYIDHAKTGLEFLSMITACLGAVDGMVMFGQRAIDGFHLDDASLGAKIITGISTGIAPALLYGSSLMASLESIAGEIAYIAQHSTHKTKDIAKLLTGLTSAIASGTGVASMAKGVTTNEHGVLYPVISNRYVTPFFEYGAAFAAVGINHGGLHNALTGLQVIPGAKARLPQDGGLRKVRTAAAPSLSTESKAPVRNYVELAAQAIRKGTVHEQVIVKAGTLGTFFSGSASASKKLIVRTGSSSALPSVVTDDPNTNLLSPTTPRTPHSPFIRGA